jgi:hypothetical protein
MKRHLHDLGLSKFLLLAHFIHHLHHFPGDDALMLHMRTNTPRTAEQRVHRPRLKQQRKLIAIIPGIKSREKGGQLFVQHNNASLTLPLTKPQVSSHEWHA